MIKSYEDEFYGNANKRFKFNDADLVASSSSELTNSSIEETSRSNSPINNNSTPLLSKPVPNKNAMFNYGANFSMGQHFESANNNNAYNFQPYFMPQLNPANCNQAQYNQFFPGQFQMPCGNNNMRYNRSSSNDTSSSSPTTSLNSSPSNDENSPVLNNPVVLNQRFNQFGNKVEANNLTPSMRTVNGSKSQPQQPLQPLHSLVENNSAVNNEEQSRLKKRRAIPAEHKDQSYWEKRKKNNESAKRSRDMRRCKEEHLTMKAGFLEQENLQLKTELALLRSELEKLRSMTYANNLISNQQMASNR